MRCCSKAGKGLSSRCSRIGLGMLWLDKTMTATNNDDHIDGKEFVK